MSDIFIFVALLLSIKVKLIWLSFLWWFDNITDEMFIDTIEMWLYNTDITNTPTIFSVCITTFVCCIVCEQMCWLNLLVNNDAFVCDGLKYFSWEDKVTRTFFCLSQLHRVWAAFEIELVRLVNTCLFEIDGEWGTNSRLLFYECVAGKINSSLPVTVLLFCCTVSKFVVLVIRSLMSKSIKAVLAVNVN